MITDEGKLLRALEYAEHVRNLIKRKSIREDEINHLRDEMGLTSIAIGDKVSTSPSADAIPNAVIKLQELIQDYVIDLSEVVDEIRVFNACIDQLDTTQAKILHARYIRLMPWKPIADEIGYAEKYIFEVRDRGLIALYDVMPTCWRSWDAPDAEDLTDSD